MSVEDYVTVHTGGRGFDIVYDTVGGATLDASFNAVCRFGHVVSALGWGTHALAPLSFRAASYSGVFTLSTVGEAYRALESNDAAGKIVVDIRGCAVPAPHQ